MNEIVFDAEFNGLYPDRIHVFSYTIDGGKTVTSLNDYDEIKSFILQHAENSYFIGHNIIRFDIVHLCRLLEIDITVFKNTVDTLSLSWYLYPDRNKHGIESWGEDYNIEKPIIDDWENLEYKDYEHRCNRDVQINSKIWKNFKERLFLIYRDVNNMKRFIKYLSFKLECARLQEFSRWKLDVELCKKNLDILNSLKQEKIDELSSAMPQVPKYVKRIKPKVLYKKDGTISAHGIKWYALLEDQNLPSTHEDEVKVVHHYDPPNPSSHIQIKAWLDSLGWEPIYFKQNEKGEEVPQIGVEDPDRKGELCDSVLALVEKEPAIKALEGLSVINHRIGILEGFLENVDEEGFLKAEIAGLTNTLRFKHTTIVNLPSITKPYGEFIRPVLIACDDDHELCGSDMSSLEDRTKQHYMYVYDPDYVEEMNTEGFDPHLDIALLGGMMTNEEVNQYKEKPTKELKNKRHGAKTTNYSCTYNAFPQKIARTAKITLEEAQSLWKAFWERNWAIKEIAKNVKINTLPTDKSMWLYNPVSNFWYSLRYDKDRFSTLNQGTGSYCFDRWLYHVLKRRPQLTAQFHDEGVWCVKKGNRERMEKILKDSIEDVNIELNLNRRLDIGIDWGNNYGQIH